MTDTVTKNVTENTNEETPVQTVERLSALARISIPEEQKESLAKEFESVIAYIAQLNELTVTANSTPRVPKLHNVFREDGNSYTPSSWTQKIVALFPSKVGNLLSVKKIISHD